MSHMDHEMAVRLASTVVPEVTVDQARLIVSEFLSQLAVCSMCGGEGKFVAGHGFTYPVPERNRNVLGTNGITIDKGTTWDCPQCGTHDRDESVGKDPRFIGWHCLDGYRQGECQSAKREPRYEHLHTDCGYRILLPLDLLTSQTGLG